MTSEQTLPFGHATSELPSGTGIAAAAKRLAPYLAPSPCYRSEGLSADFGFDVWLKVDTINPIGCFKLRGALNSLLVASATKPLKGACTSSTGNHGQGVAYAAKLLGVPAHIFVPQGSNPVKVARIERLGAKIRVVGRDIDEAKDEALRHAKQNQLTFVDDGEDLQMMNGAGTLGLEAALTVPQVDHVFVPMGSGTLATGVAAAIKSRHPNAKATTVQATGSPAMTKSFHARKAVEAPIQTIADGLMCRVPAERAVDALLRWIDDAILVEDERLLSAMRTLLDVEHLVVEPSGAAALAGAWSQRKKLAGKSVLCVLTGSNVAPEAFQRALRADPLRGG